LHLDNSSGAEVGRQTYAAFGETRTSSGDMLPARLYTGQRALEELGIYYYNARWYDPYLNRFLSADTMVPGAADSQAYDRYSYSRNNPVKFADPSGHAYTGCANPDGEGGCGTGIIHHSTWEQIYGIEFIGSWNGEQKGWVRDAIIDISQKMAETYSNHNAVFVFRASLGIMAGDPLRFEMGACEMCEGAGAYTQSPRRIEFDYEMPFSTNRGGTRSDTVVHDLNVHQVIHELGHAFSNRLRYGSDLDLYAQLDSAHLVMQGGYAEAPENAYLLWQPNHTTNPSETFANMVLGWTYDQWADDRVGQERREFMNTNMPIWIALMIDIP